MLITNFRVNKCLFDIQGSSWISSCTDSRAQDVPDRGQGGCGAVRRQAQGRKKESRRSGS